MSTALVFAFTAGAVATVNPCGFALLPVWFAGQLESRADAPALVRFVRAGLDAVAATAGFVIIFILAGLLVGAGAAWLGPLLPYAGVAIGVGLLVWGVASLLAIELPKTRAMATCRRISTRYGAFGFGLSYGFVSLTCTLPIFTAVAGISLVGDSNLAWLDIAAYLAGAGAVLSLVSVLAAMLGTGLFSAIGTRQNLVRRIAGSLGTLAGLYVTLYWGTVLFGEVPWIRAILNGGLGWAAELNKMISNPTGLTVVFLSLIAILAASAIAMFLRRPGTGRDGTNGG